MKTSFLIFLTLFLYSHKKISGQNKFSKLNDTIVIKTKIQKGDGLFQLGAAPLALINASEKPNNNFFKYPNNIQNIKHTESLSSDFVDIMTGTNNGRNIFIIDENGNKDFSDDKIQSTKKILWSKNDKPIKYNHKTNTKGYSWFRMGLVRDDFYFGRSEHLIGEFTIDNKSFTIHIADPMNALGSSYNIDPILALIKNQNIVKDSISNRDLLKLGEYLNLNGAYYKFNNISKNGEFITLIKEKNFNNKIGTQVGMIAPSFEAVSTSGDTINNNKLSNKITLVANSCGCGGDKKSTQAYYDIKKNYKDLNVIHVDSKIDTELDGIHIDTENSFNKDFYENYRKQYCSRIVYVIGKDNRIIDKFEITDWKPILQKTHK
ncbi:hypothetical protein RBH94_08255 [Aestuariibaculum sp. YM273]|uniref:hypothetical protein n=1 Tax=Aestuariibaculum sp. YM273 TaxID=3070659 RepID=UPI0027DC1D3E|nr:hypothetical protein [Aestuariibaculum sp. YM273]WMI64062.1 hypothetical protein RBH94_08255 [Aestuariibaculum sp. YM273]